MEQKVFTFELVSCFLLHALLGSTTDTLRAQAAPFFMLNFDQTPLFRKTHAGGGYSSAPPQNKTPPPSANEPAISELRRAFQMFLFALSFPFAAL